MTEPETDESLWPVWNAARSLRRWTFAAGALLLAYLASVAVHVAWIAKLNAEIQGEIDWYFVAGLAGMGIVFAAIVALPAWFALAASQHAARAVASRSLQPLLACVAWLRRLLVVGVLCLLVYAALVALAVTVYFLRGQNASG